MKGYKFCCYSILTAGLLAGCQSTQPPLPQGQHLERGTANMKMHIFNENEDIDTQQPLPHTGTTVPNSGSPNEGLKGKMVIFSDKISQNQVSDNITAGIVDTGNQPPGKDLVIDQGQVSRETDDAIYIREYHDRFGLTFSFLPGYRQDELHWSIAAPGGVPNILSELQWQDLSIGYVGGEVEISTPWNIILQGRGGYGFIFDGKNQDSDYFGNDRTLEFSRSNNNSDNGYVLDGSGALGYRFDFIANGEIDPWFSLAPLAGYSYHQQNLNITDGFQTIPPNGPFPNLYSSYDTVWKGPWLGFDVDVALTNNWDVSTGFEYHFADYSAKANWNLRPEFRHPLSYTHEADGYGLVFDLKTRYWFTDYLALQASGYYHYWRAEDGVDKTFFNDGRVLTTQLNEVVWQSFGFNLGLNFEF